MPTPADVLRQARREARRISSVQSRAAAYAELALRAEAISPAAADDMWQLARECAINVDDPVAQLRTRCSVARRLARSPRKEDAALYAQAIFKAALGLPIASHRAVILAEVQPILAELKLPQAAEAFARAVEAGGKVPEPLVRAGVLADLALLAAASDPKQARTVAQRAEQAWRLAEKGVERDLAATGLVKAWALLDWDHALAVAGELSDTQAKAQALQAAAEELARTNLDQALMAVRSISSPELRALALAAVACQAAQDRGDLAGIMAREALRQVQAAGGALGDLVRAKAAVALAASSPEQARQVLAKVGDEIVRARATAEVAKIVAETDAEAAAALLEACDHPELIETAWTEVARQAAKKDATLAVKLGRRPLDRFLRVKALLAVYDVLAEQTTPAEEPAKGDKN
ncbi:MAG: hypothetical protein J7M26_06955 [Armatimonadetes bacterium]|nr:hypothetical protein [Armatimonadota bacterium]